jgi:GT2 family glycosyltransferase
MQASSDAQFEIARAGVVPGKIGIVTVTYNSASVLPDFLQSLERQTHSNFILCAVDNASTDGTVDQLRRWDDPRLVLIPNAHNAGIATADNQGIEAALAAGCDTILFLNNDIVFGPNLFSLLTCGLESYSCSITVPLIYFHDSPNKIWAAGGKFEPQWAYQSRHTGEGEEDTGQYSRPMPIQFAPGCCVLVRREVFEQIGLIDERYFVYAEDTDFMYRALRANIRAFLVPEAKLWHKVSSLTGGSRSDFTLYYGSRGRALFLAKHFGALQGAIWALVYSIFYPLRSLLGKDSWRQAAIRVKGILNGYKVGRTRYETQRLKLKVATGRYETGK